MKRALLLAVIINSDKAESKAIIVKNKHVYLNVFIMALGKAEAKKISDSVLKNKLAACANIIDGVNSSYWWRGKIVKSIETLIIMKTRSDCMANLLKMVKQLHSYSVPEIIALPIVGGNTDYMKWINESVE